LGRDERILVPSPAASTTTKIGRLIPVSLAATAFPVALLSGVSRGTFLSRGVQCVE
jgi:hypothetical protein